MEMINILASTGGTDLVPVSSTPVITDENTVVSDTAGSVTHAEPSLTLPEFCERFLGYAADMGDNMLWIAWFAFVIAIALATLGGIITLLEKWRDYRGTKAAAADPPKPGIRRVSATMIEALAKMVDALAKGPAWLFLFFAGLLLVFFAPMDTPKACDSKFGITAEDDK